MQAITTKYYGPGNVRGSRIVAKSASGIRLSHNFETEYNADINHANAARALALKLGWHGSYVGGYIADSEMAFVPEVAAKTTGGYFIACEPTK